MPSDVPFGDDWDEEWGEGDKIVLPALATALQYADAVSPEEQWDTCCVCGCAGDCTSYDTLARGLVLLADNTLGRAAWCARLGCASEKYQSSYIPWKD
jgi:hypothetical protein